MFFSFICSNLICICFCILFSYLKVFIYLLVSPLSIWILLNYSFTFQMLSFWFYLLSPVKLFFIFKIISCSCHHILFILFSLACLRIPFLISSVEFFLKHSLYQPPKKRKFQIIKFPKSTPLNTFHRDYCGMF